MNKRLLLLVLTFIAFYFLLRLAYDMPNLAHGHSQFDWVPENARMLKERLGDLLLNFGFAFLPYIILFHYYPARKPLYYIGAIVVALPLLFLVGYGAARLNVSGEEVRSVRLRVFFIHNLFYLLMAAVYGIVFYFIRYSHYRELQQKNLEIQNRQSELSFLRSQVNPHFLFNSLNNIYSLVYSGSDQALPAIAGLSDLLRYMLYDASDKVPLSKEVEYIRQYIAMQRLRFEHPLQADLELEGNHAEVPIAPLLLIPFVENAFKHGDLSKDSQGVRVRVHSHAKRTWFQCRNRKGKHQKDRGGGIGLENVRRRLDLLYPSRHLLLIEEDEEWFTVNLELTHE